jgi:hypothetical protein
VSECQWGGLLGIINVPLIQNLTSSSHGTLSLNLLQMRDGYALTVSFHHGLGKMGVCDRLERSECGEVNIHSFNSIQSHLSPGPALH